MVLVVLYKKLVKPVKVAYAVINPVKTILNIFHFVIELPRQRVIVVNIFIMHWSEIKLIEVCSKVFCCQQKKPLTISGLLACT